MITDSNVNLSRWPFRRLPGDDTASLVARLRERQVTQAWASSYDALLHEDIGGVNARLAAECRTAPDFLVPFGTVNLRLPDWREDLRRCAEDFSMPGIRLFPGYQGYDLAHPDIPELFGMAARRKLLLQLVVKMEDERTQNPLVQVKPLDIRLLPDLAASADGLRLQILNYRPVGDYSEAARLARAGAVYFDTGMVESALGLEKFLKALPPERVLFGSHSPFFYFESNFLKIREAGLSDDEAAAVLAGNAAKLRGSR
jgi:predicted TIM-barrel fold metal-dependent hydrolase